MGETERGSDEPSLIEGSLMRVMIDQLVDNADFPNADGRLVVSLKPDHGFEILTSIKINVDLIQRGNIIWHKRKEDNHETISQVHAILRKSGQVLLLASFIYWNDHQPDDERLSLSTDDDTNEAVPSDELHILPQACVHSILCNLPGVTFGTYKEQNRYREGKRKAKKGKNTQINVFVWRQRWVRNNRYISAEEGEIASDQESGEKDTQRQGMGSQLRGLPSHRSTTATLKRGLGYRSGDVDTGGPYKRTRGRLMLSISVAGADAGCGRSLEDVHLGALEDGTSRLRRQHTTLVDEEQNKAPRMQQQTSSQDGTGFFQTQLAMSHDERPTIDQIGSLLNMSDPMACGLGQASSSKLRGLEAYVALRKYICWGQKDARSRSVAECIQKMVKRSGLTDLSTWKPSASWAVDSPHRLPFMVQTQEIWPECPSEFQLLTRYKEDYVNVDTPKVRSGSSPAAVWDNSSKAHVANIKNFSQVLKDYQNDTHVPRWVLNLELEIADSAPDLGGVMTALTGRFPFSYCRTRMDTNITPRGSVVDVHFDYESIISCVRGMGSKIMILWPCTPQNNDIYRRQHGQLFTLQKVWEHMLEPLVVFLNQEQAIYIPPGVYHAVVTLQSCVLQSFALVNPIAAPIIADALREEIVERKTNHIAEALAEAVTVLLDNDHSVDSNVLSVLEDCKHYPGSRTLRKRLKAIRQGVR